MNNSKHYWLSHFAEHVAHHLVDIQTLDDYIKTADKYADRMIKLVNDEYKCSVNMEIKKLSD